MQTDLEEEAARVDDAQQKAGDGESGDHRILWPT